MQFFGVGKIIFENFTPKIYSIIGNHNFILIGFFGEDIAIGFYWFAVHNSICQGDAIIKDQVSLRSGCIIFPYLILNGGADILIGAILLKK